MEPAVLLAGSIPQIPQLRSMLRQWRFNRQRSGKRGEGARELMHTLFCGLHECLFRTAALLFKPCNEIQFCGENLIECRMGGQDDVIGAVHLHELCIWNM